MILRNLFVNTSKQATDFDANVMKLLEKLQVADNWVVETQAGSQRPAAPRGFSTISGSAARTVMEALGKTDAEHWQPDLGPASRLGKALPSFESIPFETIGLNRD